MASNDALHQVIGEVFQVDPATLNDSLSHDDVPGWDSMGMVRLIGELEQRFGVEFDLLEIAEFSSIGVIRVVLTDKGVPL